MGQGGARAHAGDHLTAVSVVTIAWRNEQHAAGFADSLAAAEGSRAQLVVVVNGDEGEKAAAIVRSRLPADLVRLDANTGFSGGANAGAARATGDIVVVANLDLQFDRRFFAVLEREAAAEWDLLVPRVRQGPAGRDEGVSRRTASHRLAWVTRPPVTATRVGGGNGACLILRRATLDRRAAGIGALFDPEYHSFNEDIDLFWWAEREGLVVRYVPDLEVRHALAGSFEGAHKFRDRPPEVQRRVMANYRVTVWKNARGREWLGWPLGEAVYAAQALVFAGAGGVKRYAASWSDSVRTASAIRARRGRLRTPVNRPE
ncbi:MAG: glycosyltransferase [Actinomycetota bacterium]|nr:glycosyltransferase [Actinomycetota bacterium]